MYIKGMVILNLAIANIKLCYRNMISQQQMTQSMMIQTTTTSKVKLAAKIFTRLVIILL